MSSIQMLSHMVRPSRTGEDSSTINGDKLNATVTALSLPLFRQASYYGYELSGKRVLSSTQIIDYNLRELTSTTVMYTTQIYFTSISTELKLGEGVTLGSILKPTLPIVMIFYALSILEAYYNSFVNAIIAFISATSLLSMVLYGIYKYHNRIRVEKP